MNLKDYVVAGAQTIATPALLVYRDLVEQNVRRAIEVAGGTQRLYPHVKTHKSPRVVGLMQEAGISRFKCATIAEADMLGEAGCRDVVLAYQMVGSNVTRYVELVRAYPATDFAVLVDNPAALRELSGRLTAAGLSSRVLLDVDVGMHRTGIPIGPPAEQLYALIGSLPGVEPAGLHAYDGHAHEPDFQKRCVDADAIMEAVRALRVTLEAAGLPVPLMIMGGTPSFPCYARHADAQLSPGTFAMHDIGYATTYPDLGFVNAAVLLTRVISTPVPGAMTLDLGTKSIASDPPQPRGIILGMEDAEPGRHNEEHWAFKLPAGTSVNVGDQLYVVPTHVCPCFALHREFHVVDASRKVVDRWPVVARDRSLKV